jgi:hypothetical protein
MSFMFEMYYQPPPDPHKETMATQYVAGFGGRLSHREEAHEDSRGCVCLTFEFDDRDQAEVAAATLREQGEHVEGPVDYGL